MPKPSPLRRQQAAARGALALLFALALAPITFAQATAAPASVSGRVREGERGVAGITVTLVSSDPAQRFRAMARAKTDAEGRFLISNVAPGRYQIMPYAPVYIMQGMSDYYPPGKPLTLLAGDEVKDIEFRVERGGVITGRVTGADGAPVVAEAVYATPLEINAETPPRSVFDPRDQMTDDRGVYRLYGLAPGRYRVSVGQGGDSGGIVSFGRRKVFRRTFYPDATEEAQARVVEVKSGEESENVDITLGRPLKTYKVSGRFVSVETGQPVPNMNFGYGTLDAGGRRVGSFGNGQATNARGEFTSEGLAPGRYAVFSMPNPGPSQEVSELYSEATPFEIIEGDVTGLVVKVKRGASVSGVVQIEGVSDRAVVARLLSQARLFGWVEPRGGQQQAAPQFTARTPPVSPDGSFRIAGLRAGKLRISYASDSAEKGLSLSRIELNGANVGGGIDVAEGAQVTGVRVVLLYGTAVVTGQITFVNGAPQPGSRVIAQARRLGGTPTPNDFGRTMEADARGYFRIEGLPAGEYEIFVRVFGKGGLQRSDPINVSVGDGGETKVAPVVDFNKQGGGDRP